MGATSSLDDLALRKQALRQLMEFHRLEMVYYFDEVAAPLLRTQSRIRWLASNPWVKYGLIGAAGVAIFTARRKGYGNTMLRAGKWLIPFVLPKIRGFLTQRVVGLVARRFGFGG